MSRIIDFYAKDEEYRKSPKFPVENQDDNEEFLFYHCKWHDYMYYPEHVTDKDGVCYRAGYYDETGKYYAELKLYHTFPEEGLVCKYCNHRIQEEALKGLETLKCPNCDASFELVTFADSIKNDKVVTSEVRFTDKSESEARRYVHMTETKVNPSHNPSRSRAAYDPHYDADAGTEFDKMIDLDERNYERLSFGYESEEQERQRKERKQGNTVVAVLFMGFIFVLTSMIYFFFH